ncbi:hypothetical protein AB834_06215 [PVC group bacterium (ex Bugula neritina AB1)]|nr:hypothetical protein AB834_06215 [PVC group bacterium (ex Bugula neritina AB1)]
MKKEKFICAFGFILLFFVPLFAGTSQISTLEDFEDANLWSPLTTLGWWHMDEEGPYTYRATKEQVFDGQFAMRLDYKKTEPLQLLGAYIDSINPKKDFRDHKGLRMYIYGSAMILLKLEVRGGSQITVSKKTTLIPDQWNKVEFDFSKIEEDISDIKNLLLFLEPDKSDSEGTLYIDSISFLKKNFSPISQNPKISHTFLKMKKKQPEVVFDLETFEKGIPIISAIDAKCDPQGNIYIIHKMGGYIFKYDSKAKYLTEIRGGGDNLVFFKDPSRIVFSKKNDCFYVLESLQGRVQKFSLDGKVIQDFADQGVWKRRGNEGTFGNLVDIAIDEEGSLYALDLSDKTIWKTSLEGKDPKLLWKNKPSTHFFSEPVRLKIFQKRLYILDKLESGMDIFDLDGKHLKSVDCRGSSGQKFSPLDCAFDPLSGACLLISSQSNGIHFFDKNWKYLGVSEIMPSSRLTFINIFVSGSKRFVLMGDRMQHKVFIFPIEELQNRMH